MPRATTGKIHQRKRAKILKDAKGFSGSRSKLYRTAKDARRKALQNSYKDRRRKKRDFRTLWIVRINAAARISGVSYSRLVKGLLSSRIGLNRKMLAALAVKDLGAFQKIVDKATSAA